MFFGQFFVEGEKKKRDTPLPVVQMGADAKKNSQNWPLERNYRKQRGGSRQRGKKSVSDLEDNMFFGQPRAEGGRERREGPLHLFWFEREVKKTAKIGTFSGNKAKQEGGPRNG